MFASLIEIRWTVFAVAPIISKWSMTPGESQGLNGPLSGRNENPFGRKFPLFPAKSLITVFVIIKRRQEKDSFEFLFEYRESFFSPPFHGWTVLKQMKKVIVSFRYASSSNALYHSWKRSNQNFLSLRDRGPFSISRAMRIWGRGRFPGLGLDLFLPERIGSWAS